MLGVDYNRCLYRFVNGAVSKEAVPENVSEESLKSAVASGAIYVNYIDHKNVDIRIENDLPERSVLFEILNDLRNIHFNSEVIFKDNQTAKEYLRGLRISKSRDSILYPNIEDEIAYKVERANHKHEIFLFYNFIAYEFDASKVDFSELKKLIPSLKPDRDAVDALLSLSELEKEENIENYMNGINVKIKEISEYNVDSMNAFKTCFEQALGRKKSEDYKIELSGDNTQKLIQINQILLDLTPSDETISIHKNAISPVHMYVQYYNRIMDSFSLNMLMKILQKKLDEEILIENKKDNATFFIERECKTSFTILRHDLIKLEELLERDGIHVGK